MIMEDNSAKSLVQSAHKATRLLKLMASEQRLLILCKLGDDEASVSDISKHLSLSQSATSQHLSKMRAEGLVETRREAQTIYYRIGNEAAKRVISLLCEIYK